VPVVEVASTIQSGPAWKGVPFLTRESPSRAGQTRLFPCDLHVNRLDVYGRSGVIYLAFYWLDSGRSEAIKWPRLKGHVYFLEELPSLEEVVVSSSVSESLQGSVFDFYGMNDFIFVVILMSWRNAVASLLICWCLSYLLLLAFEYLFKYIGYMWTSFPGLPSI